MTEEEAKEIIKNLFLMPTDWKIRKSYKGKLDFIGAIEGNEALDIIINLIQKQDTEINKLNNIIDELVGEVAVLNYETIGEWCNNDKGDKCKKCDTNNYDCIKEYFMKENTNE